MPIPYMNFLNAPLHTNDYSSLSNHLPNFLAGYKSNFAPEQIERENQRDKLLTAMKELEYKYEEPKLIGEQEKLGLHNKWYSPEKAAHIQQMLASAEHHRAASSGKNFAPSNLGKLIQEANDLRAKNPDDPLLAEYDKAIKSLNSGKKYAPSGLGKLYSELAEVEEGYLPGSNGAVPLTPEEQQDLKNRYMLQIQKNTTDSTTRTTVLRGQNLLKSINASNIDDLTQFSGPVGSYKLKKEEAKDLTGNPSEEYLKYLEALQAVKLEAKELRQFFGDSITPSTAEAIDDMVNATSWSRSPEAAKRMIEKSRATIKKQIDTFAKSLNSVEPYQYNAVGGNNNAPSIEMNGESQPGKLFGSLELEDDGGL